MLPLPGLPKRRFGRMVEGMRDITPSRPPPVRVIELRPIGKMRLSDRIAWVITFGALFVLMACGAKFIFATLTG
jgi:hypothetical protein